MVPMNELNRRITSFQEALREKGVDGALLAQRADTIYFSGTAQNIHIYIPSEGPPLVLAYRDMGRAEKECPWSVFPLTGISQIPRSISEAGLQIPEVVGLELDILSVNQYQRYEKAFSGARFVDISYPLRMLRAVKSEWEISMIEETGRIYSELVKFAPTVLRRGMTEVEFEGLIEAKARLLGHESMVRVRGFGAEFHFGIVLSGARGALPSYFDGPLNGLGVSYTHPIGSSHTPIEEGEPIIMDLALMRQGYHIDTCRVFVLGELSEEFLVAYDTSLVIEEKIRRALVPGRVAGEVYDEILNWVRTQTPYAENFMGFQSTQVRFVGHGIGLELDELPTISKGAKEVLCPGMTVSLEPKFVFPGKGAIGVEDTMVVEGAEGARYLCQASREIIRID